MEGELFAENILKVKSSSSSTVQLRSKTAQSGSVGGMERSTEKGLTGVSPRKPWETVHFDPRLKPHDYQIEGCGYTGSER
jgi:hypothetical protein